MQVDCNKNGMHDFMCTYSTQVFLNPINEFGYELDYTVFMRSNDAVYGFCNDVIWAQHVRDKLVDDLNKRGLTVFPGKIIWNAGSLHVYERHFKYLE